MMSSTNFAKKIGVTTRTLARWHESGKLVPAFVLPSGERRYTEEQVDSLRGGGVYDRHTTSETSREVSK